MTQEEAMKCRQAAQLYRALQKENQRLRMELEEKQRIDLRMNQEDNEVFALVTANRQIHPAPPHEAAHPVFDFDHAEIEPMDAQFVRMADEEEGSELFGLGYLVRFGLFVLLECSVWLAHRFGWVDLIMAMGLSLFIFLFAKVQLF